MRAAKYILPLLFSCFVGTAKSQQYTITGYLYIENQQPAHGATIYLHETKQGAATDSNGHFIIAKVKPGKYHLHISMIGYKPESKDIVIVDASISITSTLTPSSLEMNEVIIESNALKLSQKESSVELVGVDKEYLRKNLGSTLMNSLDNLPGINTINMGTGVSKPVIRGMSFNRVAVADNGIKQEGQQWGGDHGLEIDQYGIEQIEILKGPSSLVYGSDAIGGVIHLKHPQSPMKGHHKTGLLTNYKSVNNTYGLSAFAEGNHNNFVYRVRATHLEYGDYKVPADSFVYNRYKLPIYNQKLKNTAGKETHFSTMLGINKSWGYSHLTFSNYHQQVGVFSGALGIPRSYQLTPDGNERDINLPNQLINHFKIVSNSNIQIGKNWLEADLGYQYNTRDENSNPHNHGVGPTIQGNLAHRLKLQTYTANLRYHLPTLKVLDGVYGISLSSQQNRFGGYEFLLPNFNSFSLGVYAIEKWRVSTKLVANAGFRFDYNHTAIEKHLQAVWKNGAIAGYTQRNPTIVRDFYNWSASAGVAYNPDKEWGLKFNFGKSFRVPTPQELSVNGLHHGSFRHEMGDSSLLPEEGYQTDVVITLEKEKFLFSLSPFFNYFNNYIYLRPTAQFSALPEGGQVYRFSQAEALYYGGEFTAEFHPIKSLHLSIAADAVFTTNLDEDFPLPFTPPPSLKSEVEWEISKTSSVFKNLYLKIGFQHSLAQNRTDRNELATPAYNLWNMGLGFEIKSKQKTRAQVYAQVQNLGDTRYLNHLSRWRYLNLPEPGRNFVVTVIVPILVKKRK